MSLNRSLPQAGAAFFPAQKCLVLYLGDVCPLHSACGSLLGLFLDQPIICASPNVHRSVFFCSLWFWYTMYTMYQSSLGRHRLVVLFFYLIMVKLKWKLLLRCMTGEVHNWKHIVSATQKYLLISFFSSLTMISLSRYLPTKSNLNIVWFAVIVSFFLSLLLFWLDYGQLVLLDKITIRVF